MDDYLCKPFTLDTLGDYLRRFVGEKTASGAERSPADAPTSAPPASLASAPLNSGEALDVAALQRIRALGSGGSNDLLSRVVRSYLDAAPILISALREAIDNGDDEALSAAAHRLKGSSAQLGAARIAGLCADLEQAGNGNNGERGTPASLLRQLEDELGRVEVALEEECLRIAS
jgi:HPt (histidine-containing phosphotransfer) domain-containing protein